MKIQIMSDLHLDLAGNLKIKSHDTDLVILAGDITGGFDSVRWAIKTFKQPTLLILGNHEMIPNQFERLKKFRALTQGTNVYILENDLFEFQGIRFLGCTLWAPTNKAMCIAMNKSIEWLKNALSKPYQGKTIVITHHSPLHQSLSHETLRDPSLAKRLSVDLYDFIEQSNISIWVHGHIHKQQNYFCGNTQIIANPRGYSGMIEKKFNPEFKLEV